MGCKLNRICQNGTHPSKQRLGFAATCSYILPQCSSGDECALVALQKKGDGEGYLDPHVTTASLAVLGVLSQLEDQDSTVFSVRPSSRNYQ